MSTVKIMPQKCDQMRHVEFTHRSCKMAEITRKDLILMIASVASIPCRKPHFLLRLAGFDLSGLDLNGLNLAFADLAGANLRGCDLTDANLAESDLSHADLTDAILRGVYAESAVFTQANLTRADFRKSQRDRFYGTNVMWADFQGADCTSAKFSGLRLCGVNFNDSILAATDFTAARINQHTVFEHVDLSTTMFNEVVWSDAIPLTATAAQAPLFTSVAENISTLRIAG